MYIAYPWHRYINTHHSRIINRCLLVGQDKIHWPARNPKSRESKFVIGRVLTGNRASGWWARFSLDWCGRVRVSKKKWSKTETNGWDFKWHRIDDVDKQWTAEITSSCVSSIFWNLIFLLDYSLCCFWITLSIVSVLRFSSTHFQILPFIWSYFAVRVTTRSNPPDLPVARSTRHPSYPELQTNENGLRYRHFSFDRCYSFWLNPVRNRPLSNPTF